MTRCEGATALQTSAALADWGVANAGMSVNNMAVCATSDWQSALIGAPVCGANNAVMVLAQAAKADTWPVANFAKPNAEQIRHGYILGTAITDEVMAAFEDATA